MEKRNRPVPRHLVVERQLAEMLAGVVVPELGGEFPLVSLTRIELTRDMKDGTVWVTAAPGADEPKLISALARRLPEWRRTLRGQLSTRYFPNLVFKYDHGQAEILKIEELLDEARLGDE